MSTKNHVGIGPKVVRMVSVSPISAAASSNGGIAAEAVKSGDIIKTVPAMFLRLLSQFPDGPRMRSYTKVGHVEAET